MSQTATPELPALSYATPAPMTRGPRIWACLILVIGALGLVFLGGCFMIGIMQLNSPNAGFGGGAGGLPVSKTAGQVILEVVLYVIAFGCFGGALSLFFLAVKWLRRVVFA